MKPGVTLSMIVRNESSNLRRCLESAAEYMDAIQIVDTGSSDDTIEVAEEFGAEVFEIPWPDAFDVARNYGFDQVKTQWTFWLDADEWLMPDAGGVIRQVIKLWEAAAYFVTRLDYRDDGGHSPVELVRLWRTHPAMRVNGIIHENFPEGALIEATKQRPILLAPVFIGHDGYIDALSPEKMTRNETLLRRQLAKRPYSFYHDAHLQYSLYGSNNPDGLAGFRRLADLVIDTWPRYRHESMSSVILCIVLSHMDESEVQSERTGQIIQLIRQTYPFAPAAMWEAYKALARRGQKQDSLVVLRELQRRGRTGDYERINVFDPKLFPLVDQLLLEESNPGASKN